MRIGRLSNFVRSPVPFSPELLDNCESRWRNYVVLTTLAVRFGEDGVVPIRRVNVVGRFCGFGGFTFIFVFRASARAARDIFLGLAWPEKIRGTLLLTL